MESIKELYKIGFGPSSSHTMGPAIASEQFLKKNLDATSFEVELYGSLALTGKGHLTDKIIYSVLGKERTKVLFNYDIIYEYHPNAMKLSAFKNGELIDSCLTFSVGGGELRELNEPRNLYKEKVYEENSYSEILKYCKENNLKVIDYIKLKDQNLMPYLEKVYVAMEKSLEKGLNSSGNLPGRLAIPRKANLFYQKYLETKSLNSLIFAYALAVSEQNASGEIIVTAPTCGSSGVVPAVLFALQKYYGYSKEQLIDGLAIAGLIGNVVKTNASISGAEVGCQGEIGVACSMAAAASCYLKGGSDEYIEYAAEIGLEHHLGMTCDPVDGMVQIPCIERNAMSAIFSVTASDYALMTDGKHYVNLDNVIDVMNETGRDLHSKYRETSVGGLALKIKE